MYASFTLREDPIGFFMGSDNYQPRLVLKDIMSAIDDFSVLFEENIEYELKVETFTLARGQNFIEMFGLMLASFYNTEKTGRITDVFVKVSFRNRRWNKNTAKGSATYIKSKESYHLDLKLHIY